MLIRLTGSSLRNLSRRGHRWCFRAAADQISSMSKSCRKDQRKNLLRISCFKKKFFTRGTSKDNTKQWQALITLPFIALKHSSLAVKRTCAGLLKMHNIQIWRWREDKREHACLWLDIFPSYFCRSQSGAVYLVVSNPSCFIMTVLVHNFCCYFKT